MSLPSLFFCVFKYKFTVVFIFFSAYKQCLFDSTFLYINKTNYLTMIYIKCLLVLLFQNHCINIYMYISKVSLYETYAKKWRNVTLTYPLYINEHQNEQYLELTAKLFDCQTVAQDAKRRGDAKLQKEAGHQIAKYHRGKSIDW